MDWFKKHSDSVITIFTLLSALYYMQQNINDRFSALEKDITIIKTVLVLKNIMPAELAKAECNVDH